MRQSFLVPVPPIALHTFSIMLVLAPFYNLDSGAISKLEKHDVSELQLQHITATITKTTVVGVSADRPLRYQECKNPPRSEFLFTTCLSSSQIDIKCQLLI